MSEQLVSNEEEEMPPMPSQEEMMARVDVMMKDKEEKFRNSIDHEAIADFNKRAHEVEMQVKGIIDGTIDIDEIDRIEHEKEIISKGKEDVEKREKREWELKGRPGKGHQGRYAWICTRCYTEYWIEDIEKCTHCGNKDLLTQEERMANLKAKLVDYQKDVKKKKTRRGKWENWKKTQALFYCKTSTNYHKWDMFESETDSDKEEAEPIVPKDDPQFKAMEQDFNDRHQRRVRSKKIGIELKLKGNEALKRGLYKSAYKYYSDAIEEKKDLLACYTNRALTCIKLENMQQAIDDCTRVLDYCEVFDEDLSKNKDLAFKAYLRRGMANKFKRDFDLAKSDFIEAQKLQPEGDLICEKMLKQNQEEQEYQIKLAVIMSNADTLKGKEYIDYLLKFLSGKLDNKVDTQNEMEAKNAKKRKQVCFHELTEEDAEKLVATLKDKNILYYFNISSGLKILVDSLYISTRALPIIFNALEQDPKLMHDFQREHLYEGLIDFMSTMNKNVEDKTLGYPDMLSILQILEAGSLNEEVRNNLSDKKKIKDLFLVVIRSIEINKNKMLVASLLSFISNLCYGQGKLKQMLAREEMTEFYASIMQIMDQAKKEVTFQETEGYDEEDVENNDPLKILEFIKTQQRDRSTLRSSLYGFISNLCTEKQLRVNFACDMGGVLSQMIADFKFDIGMKNFDWKDQVFKALACFVNMSIEDSAQKIFIEKKILDDMEQLLKEFKTTDKEEQQVIFRVYNFYSKMISKNEAAAKIVMMQRHTVFKTILYFNSQFKEGDLQLNALRTLHPLCKQENFKDVCMNEHKFTAAVFDVYVKEVIKLFKLSQDKSQQADGKEDWTTFVNSCASTVAFLGTFPERVQEFEPMIKDLIRIVKDKTDVVRKNAAILLAKLANDETMNQKIRDNHGFDVLMSLRDIFSAKKMNDHS